MNMPNINSKLQDNDIFDEVKNILRNIYPNSSLINDPRLEKAFSVKRNKWQSYEIKFNKEKVDKINPDVIWLKIISSIEILESLWKIKINQNYSQEYEKYLKNISVWAMKFMYSFLFEVISIHKKHIPPSYTKKLEEVLKNQYSKLASRYNPIPKHIDFLLWIAWLKPKDKEVEEAIENLKQADVIGFIFDPRQLDEEKLKSININILPLYKYFLGYDKYKYKPQKKSVGKINKTKTKVEEVISQEEPLKEEKIQKLEEDNRTPDNWQKESSQNPETDKKKEEEKWWEKQNEWQNEWQNENQEKSESEKQEDWNQEESKQEESQEWWDNANEWQSWNQSSWNSWWEKQNEKQNESEEQSFPDYQDTYKTPEWWQFEKDPDGKWFKIEIHPWLLGYYVNDHKSFYNRKNLEWTNNSTLHVFNQTPATKWPKYTLEANYSWDKLKAIPIPYSYALDISSLKYIWDKPTIYRDENWAFYIKITNKSKISIDFYKEEGFTCPQPTKDDSEKIYSWNITPNWEKAMNEAMSLPNIKDKATHIRDYIVRNHYYPAGKNSKETMNNARIIQEKLKKISNESNYIYNLDSSKHLECYSANTLLVAMLRNIWIQCRIVTWFHVQQFNQVWNAELTSSNWHWWCEIWDWTMWKRYDATPDKDPKDPANKPDPNEEKDSSDNQNKSQNSEKADDGWEDRDWWESNQNDSSSWKNWNWENWEGKSDNDDQNSDEGWEWGSSNKGGWKEKKKWAKEDTENPSEGNQNSDEKEEDWDENDDNIEKEERNKDEFDKISEETEDIEEDEDFDSEEEFRKMYEELEEDTSTLPDEEDVDNTSKQILEEESEVKEEDNDERNMRVKYPELSQEQVKQMGQFLKEFRKELNQISKLKNPDFDNWKSENETLEEELKSIIDRVVSKSIKEKDYPRYPVDDWYNLELIDPVQLYMDKTEWREESFSFKTTETRNEEELKIVKVRRRKILDASGSMSPSWSWWDKLKIQKQIEVLDNKVTAEKQKELEELSNELDRDIRLETETWQFWVNWPGWKDYAVLKPMSSDFHELEQATVWKLAERASWGTNDFDPLEEIQRILLKEYTEELKEDSNKVTILERIRAWFLIREINAYKELELKWDELSREEKIHLINLNTSSPLELFRIILSFLIHKKIDKKEIELINKITAINVVDDYKNWISSYGKNLLLSLEELEYFKKLDIWNTTFIEILDWWLQAIKEKDAEIEPILEIIEISSDWWSNDSNRLKNVVSQLRWLWVIVIAYWLWEDWKAVETVYSNNYNPIEWWYFCKNLLDYPRKKAKAWHNILDKI